MRKISFLPDAFEHYNFWSSEDRRIRKRIADLIIEIARDPYRGIEKPEGLRGNLKGLWSRRITGEHRLVYQVTDDEILIYSCRFHYKK